LLAASPSLIQSDDLLIAAVDFGHHDLVQWLLDRGANPSARWSMGSRGTALHSAAWNGDLKMVRLLVAAGADLHALDREYNGTAEQFARVSIEVSNNPKCAEVVEYLREAASGI
jgi:ankyrin repeat protein